MIKGRKSKWFPAFCLDYNYLAFNIWLFKSKVLLLVNYLQDESNNQGDYTQTGKHDQRSCIVELRRVGYSNIRFVKNLANKQWEQP